LCWLMPHSTVWALRVWLAMIKVQREGQDVALSPHRVICILPVVLHWISFHKKMFLVWLECRKLWNPREKEVADRKWILSSSVIRLVLWVPDFRVTMHSGGFLSSHFKCFLLLSQPVFFPGDASLLFFPFFFQCVHI